MHAEPKISVLVPIYMVEPYIERCVRSLFEQTMTDGVEFIFVNDASKDRSMDILSDILRQYPSRQSQVRLVSHNVNKGLAVARITALNLAKGEYVINLDSDDFFETDMLEAMYSLAKKQNADIVVADYFLSYNNREIYVPCPVDSDKDQLISNLICNKNGVGRMVWNKLIRRELYEKYSVRPLPGINIGEDLIVTAQLLFLANSIAKIDRAFAHYNKSNLNTYTSSPTSLDALKRFTVCDFLADFFGDRSPQNSEAINRHRFQVKALAIINSPIQSQPQILSYYPQLTFRRYHHEVAWYWKIPVWLSLNGNTRIFSVMRDITLRLRYFYRAFRNRN